MMKNLSVLLLTVLSVNAFAQEISTREVIGSPASTSFKVSGSTDNTGRQLGFRQESRELRVSRKLVTTVSIPTVTYSCEDIEIQGDGKGEWYGFYSAPRSEKAAALDKAIAGVGKKTAPYLVDAFSAKKPRSWSQFKKVILGVAKEMEAQGLDTNFVNEVLYTHKEENMRNLGYIADGATVCTATQTVQKIESSQAMEDLRALVKVSASNIALLPGESESITISYDGKNISTSLSQTYNKMDRSFDLSDEGRRYDSSATIQVNGRGRIAVTPPNLVNQNQSSLAGDGSVTLSHSEIDALMANSEFAEKCQASVNATVIATKGSGWFAKDRPSTSAVIKLDMKNGSTRGSVGNLGLQKDESASIDYTVSFAPGCPYYNTSPSIGSHIE